MSQPPQMHRLDFDNLSLYQRNQIAGSQFERYYVYNVPPAVLRENGNDEPPNKEILDTIKFRKHPFEAYDNYDLNNPVNAELDALLTDKTYKKAYAQWMSIPDCESEYNICNCENDELIEMYHEGNKYVAAQLEDPTFVMPLDHAQIAIIDREITRRDLNPVTDLERIQVTALAPNASKEDILDHLIETTGFANSILGNNIACKAYQSLDNKPLTDVIKSMGDEAHIEFMEFQMELMPQYAKAIFDDDLYDKLVAEGGDSKEEAEFVRERAGPMQAMIAAAETMQNLYKEVAPQHYQSDVKAEHEQRFAPSAPKRKYSNDFELSL